MSRQRLEAWNILKTSVFFCISLYVLVVEGIAKHDQFGIKVGVLFTISSILFVISASIRYKKARNEAKQGGGTQ